MSEEECELALAAALKECGNTDLFLDRFFGFLAKRTDFYVECPPEGGRIGFPEGYAEAMVRNKFRKWQKYAKERTTATIPVEEGPKLSRLSVDNVEGKEKESHEQSKRLGRVKDEEEAYNGRVTEKYAWSQNIMEVDVKVPVGSQIKKGKQVQVLIESMRISVAEVGKEKDPIVEGQLTFPVKKDGSYWNLVPGECVRIWLQKAQERWWQALLEGEELLDMNKIEAVRPMEELDEEEQMKIQELCWNEERKRQGLPTSEEMKMEQILAKAWNAEGSPFKGTPMDPSIVQCLPQNEGTHFGTSPATTNTGGDSSS